MNLVNTNTVIPKATKQAIFSGPIEKLSGWIVSPIDTTSNVTNIKTLEVLTAPLTDLIVQVGLLLDFRLKSTV